MLITGGVLVCVCLDSWSPTAKDVNATGIAGGFGTLPLKTPMRPAGLGLPSLKMITPDAPAATALSIFAWNVQVPRWISAMLPGWNPAKSACGSQPLAELGVSVGGSTMGPTA